MAVTIFSTPASEVSGYRPIIWDIQSDRFGEQIATVTAIADDGGGFAKYTTSPAHSILVGDVVTPNMFATVYNVRQTVTAVTATTITTDFVFSVTSTGPLTRTNTGFQIRGDVFAFLGEPVKSIDLVADGSPDAIFNVVEHRYVVGDFVQITGTASYNAFVAVTEVTGPDAFKTGQAFAGSETGSVQQLTLVGQKLVSAIRVGSDDLFRFNFQNFLRSIVTSDLAATGGNAILTPNDNSIKDYKTRFTEQYDDAAGLLQSKDQILGDTKKVTNITLQHEETQDLARFLVDTSAKLFLTNVPNLHKVLRTGHLQLGFLTNLATIKFKIVQFDDVGAIVGTAISAGDTIVGKRGTLRIDVSSMVATAVRFTVQLLTSGAAANSEVKTFLIDDICHENEIEIYFLNLLGAFDSFVFTGHRREAPRSRKTEFDKLLPKTFATQDRGRTTLGVKTGKRFEIFGPFITDEESLWLEELESSPDVLQLKGSDYVPLIAMRFRGRTIDEPSIAMPRIQYELANAPIIQDN